MLISTILQEHRKQKKSLSKEDQLQIKTLQHKLGVLYYLSPMDEQYELGTISHKERINNQLNFLEELEQDTEHDYFFKDEIKEFKEMVKEKEQGVKYTLTIKKSHSDICDKIDQIMIDGGMK